MPGGSPVILIAKFLDKLGIRMGRRLVKKIPGEKGPDTGDRRRP